MSRKRGINRSDVTSPVAIGPANSSKIAEQNLLKAQELGIKTEGLTSDRVSVAIATVEESKHTLKSFRGVDVSTLGSDVQKAIREAEENLDSLGIPYSK